MSTEKTKKKNLKKDKKKKEIEEIKIIKHERVGNYNYYSEEIANIIIEKIISYVITVQYRRTIDNKVNNACFDFLKKEISSFVKLNYLNYDIDDIYSNKKLLLNKKELKTEFENEYIKKTRNKKLKELNLNTLNYTNNKSSNKNIKDEIPLMYNISFPENNFWDEISQPKVPIKERNASTQIEIKVNKIKQNKKKIKEINKESSKKKLKKVYISKKINSNLGDEIIIKKKKIINFDSFDIPIYLEKNNNELPEINKLREEIELKIKKKLQDELILKQKIEAEKNAKKNKENNSLNGNKKLKNFSTDINGNLIMVKEIEIEKLQKEFTSIQSKYNEILICPDSNNKNNNNEENNITKIKNYKKKEYKISKTPIPILKNTIIHNNENKKIEKIIFNYNQRLTPSGSNFGLFQPEIGVKISENQRVKYGGNNYFKKYNKYSIYNFLKMLNGNKIKNSDLKEEMYRTFNQTQEEKNIILEEENKKKFNKTLSHFNKRLNKSSSTGNIIMNNNSKFSTLSAAINKSDCPNDYIYNYKNENYNNNNLNNNLFKHYSLKKKSNIPKFYSNNINDIEKFSKTLFSDRLWLKQNKSLNHFFDNNEKDNNKLFMDNSSLSIPKSHFKPQQKEIEREMGMNITMYKLPRVRMKKIGENILFNNNSLNVKKIQKK